MCSVGKIVIQILSLCIIVKHCDSREYINNTYLRVTREINKNGCTLPQHPSFGKWNIYEGTSQLNPGQIVPKKTVLQVNCKDNYKLDGDATMICLDGKWSSEIGQCLRTCPSRYSTPIMTVTCSYNGRPLELCEQPLEGTVARFQCADYYEDKGLERYQAHVCRNDGQWNYVLPQCVPVCGQKSTKHDPTLIVKGKNVTKGEYPWQVALYNVTDKELLCGGSLLNQRVILTAAHCVTNAEGKLHSKELYMVAAGKYFRRYDHPEDFHEAQFSAIYDMYIPREYKGDIQNYFGDIALLVTKKTFLLSSRVQPVCVDWGSHYHQPLIDTKKIKHGHVTGWGFTVEFQNPSDVLKELNVPIIGEKECTNKIPEDYRRFMTADKLCAGFLDSGKSVCKGDSGGGLVARYGDRFYVIGIVSLSPQAPTEEGGCDSQQYSLYTSVSYYVESFIINTEATFNPGPSGLNLDCEDDPNCRTSVSTTTPPPTTTTTTRPVTETLNNCVLPEYPHSGRWSVFGVTTSFSPGMKVSPGTILLVSCNKDYTLRGAQNILCENGKWATEIGKCLRSCPPLRNSDTVEITCSYNDEEMKNCTNPLDGTIARHQCAPFYEDLQLAKNPVRVCRNGSWDMKKPECVPLCGLKSVTPQTLIVNGNTVKQGEYPWQVAIYRGARRQFSCGGALISQKLILTAAHCVTNWKGQLQPKSDYTVAVGKFYREYHNSRDDKAQFSQLQDIFVPLQYAGLKNNFLADIAVLVAENTFVLSQRVQPVCVDWGLNFVNISTSQNVSGYITGWGFTVPDSKPSDTLQDLQVPIVAREECVQALPDDFRVFVTSDTFCAGYLNNNTSVCSGDAGGPLVTKHDGRYFVTGIVSTAPALPQGGCNSMQYTLYTKVSDYNSFISEKEAQIKTSTSTDSECRNSEDPSCQITTAKPPEKPQTEKSTCTLPQHPQFGKWSIFGSSSPQLLPGTTVSEGTLLQVSCYSSYKLSAGGTVLCENGKWSTNIGKCLKTCPSVKSTQIMKATCIINGRESEGCDQPTDGTSVKYECAPLYEDPQLSQNPVHLCEDGKWSHKTPECVPMCGQKIVTPQILIVNGKPTNKGEYPWHVAIYRGTQNEFICSGTLIGQRIILTAAQCVTRYDGKVRPKTLYTVAAGKYYRKFDDAREDNNDMQSSTLDDIIIHPQYKGLSRMSMGSIAILVTTKNFTITPRVQPACVDWALKYEKELTQSNNLTAYVTGWGFTKETESPADTLQVLQVPITSNEKCQEELPDQFSNFLTYDKFCAGYRNQGKSVCKGDSGGPLVTKFNGRYYVVGIVDSAPVKSNGGCDSQQYALYAKISTYIDNFILQSTKQYN